MAAASESERLAQEAIAKDLAARFDSTHGVEQQEPLLGHQMSCSEHAAAINACLAVD